MQQVLYRRKNNHAWQIKNIRVLAKLKKVAAGIELISISP
jgi:hypothetical protein